MAFRLLEPGKGGERTREIPIAGDEFLLGRGSDCDLRLHDDAISRHHCLIRVRGTDVSLVDLGSSNGTFVNGQRVLSQVALKTGDEISLGECRYIVDLGDNPTLVEPYSQSDIDPMAVTCRRPPQQPFAKPRTIENPK